MFIKPVQRQLLTARLAALDALRAKVMVADCDLNIVHVNPAAMALMRAAEPELKRELPRFGVDTLIGSNIDVFHRNPDHQRTMLARMEQPHNATIRVGRRVFDLLVSPLKEAGARIGFAVEWEDAEHRLLNLDYAAQIAAISRSQTIIEFATDGTILNANDHFLSCMGYTLEELKGRHHRIFVEPDYAASREYATFWEELRQGKYRAAQFKRVAKGGRSVWIEGSYNPIFNEHGKVAKVVKFATDISPQMALLANLRGLIGEIETAAAGSTAKAESASLAADATVANVRSIAASADELVSSIQEIARSMARSREATESVSGQADEVSRSTQAMATAAQAMNGIVGLIRSVASQINLLALNATIEAARAGDAGKGFAVVASEVKNLAFQAAKATEQITREIDGIQSISSDVAGAIVSIRDGIATVREQVTVTAAAIEEQTAVTHGMASSMEEASSTMSTISGNIAEISSTVGQLVQAVGKTNEAAKALDR